MSRTVSPVDVNGPVGRVVQKVAGSHAFAPVAKHVVPRLDRALNRVTGGRFVVSALVAPSLVLTTTGAKSGRPRPTPLVTLPDDDGSFLVVGSNFGQLRHPAWTGNLLKHPDASVTCAGRTFPVRARLLDGEERAQAWPRLTAVWPVYDRYVEMSGRDLRVFRLIPQEVPR